MKALLGKALGRLPVARWLAQIPLALVDADIARYFVDDGSLAINEPADRLAESARDLRSRRLRAVRLLTWLGLHDPHPDWLVGQRIAIYATKRTSELPSCGSELFCQYVPDARSLPLAAVVATCMLDRCSEMTADGIAALAEEQPHEHAFGIYKIGRFAWVLRDVERVEVPFTWPKQGPAKFIDVPDDLLGYTPPPVAQGALL